MGGQAFWDWSLSNVLSAGQLVLTVAGFAIAIFQLTRSANASVQTKSLLQKLRLRLVENDLMDALPQLSALEDELADAVRRQDDEAATRVLVAYSRHASSVIGLMEATAAHADEPLLAQLRLAETSARRAKGEIANGSDRALAQLVAAATSKIAKVSSQAAVLRVRLQKEADSE